MECYVAASGDDANAGAANSPFRTIGRAAAIMGPGDLCRVHGGTYRETVRPPISGSADKPIRFEACPGETVVLSGLEPVAGEWRLHQGEVYRSHAATPFTQLFVDGRMMIEARWPKAGFEELLDRSRWARTHADSRYGLVVDPELARTGIDWTGATATLNVAHQFYTWTRTVRRHAAGADRFEYDQDLPGLAGFAGKEKGWGNNAYYLAGKLAALDQPGEWFLDPDDGELYLWAPAGGDPGRSLVEGKARDYGFLAEDVDFVELCGFHFFGCTTHFARCNHCRVEQCHLQFPTYAREITEFDADRQPTPATLMTGSHNAMRDCSLAYSATGGIAMEGSHNTVENCLVHDVCWNGSLRYCGIQLTPGAEGEPAGRCVVRGNTVFDTGNVGVHVGGMPANLVELNHIYDGGRACKDVSLLYTQLPVIAGTVFRRNWVHDCHAPHLALGIRGDDQTRGLEISQNVVWNCDWDGIVIKGDNNRIEHNTCFNNAGSDILAFQRDEPHKPWRNQWPLLPEQNRHSRIWHNCTRRIIGWRGPDNTPPGGDVSHNYEGDDPRLADPERLDFRPAPDSPLLGAGRALPNAEEPPDIGAYQRGEEYWIPGYRNAFQLAAPKLSVAPGATARLAVALRMPPLEPLRVEVASTGVEIRSAAALEFTTEDWMTPQLVEIAAPAVAGEPAHIRLTAAAVETTTIQVVCES